jgi:predicted esterase
MYALLCSLFIYTHVLFISPGAVALYTGLTAPFRLGGILALSTWLPLDKLIPWDKIQTPPILLCHGDEDTMIDLSRAEKTAQLLQSGFQNKIKEPSKIDFQVYPGLGHTVACEEELTHIHEWLGKILSNKSNGAQVGNQDRDKSRL